MLKTDERVPVWVQQTTQTESPEKRECANENSPVIVGSPDCCSGELVAEFVYAWLVASGIQ
ncbi:hypothetical protein, partial [Thalassoglobus neptunius]|uniref:hypothetical protein n=1 Tax=Thalassoglobus neptunius TaxID=1938619 RepID=UPI001E6219A1